jgi:DNA-binding transcriptional LysR family regulator
MNRIDVSKIKLFQLRAFVAVADYGSFGEAAASLNLTQSAISHAIASLEEELGVMLLIRGRQGASLTDVGEQVIGEVQQVLQLLDVVVALIMPAPNDQGYAPLRSYIATAEAPLKIAYEINEDSTIVSMVAQNLGIAMLPHLAALPIPATVQICRPPRPLSRLLVAAILEDALQSPAILVFLDQIKQQVPLIGTPLDPPALR